MAKGVKNRLSETENIQNTCWRQEGCVLLEKLGRIRSDPPCVSVCWDGGPACCDEQLLKRAGETANC